MILCLAYVADDGLKAFLVVDIECASTLSPPFLANRRGRGIMCGEWTETFLLQRLEPAGAPGFELLPDLLDRQWSIRRAGAGPGREGRHLPSSGPAPRVCERDREVANRGGTRPTRAHRRAARCRTLARSENRPRVRAKAVRNHVSLCFSAVSRAPGPSMSPLIMSHINRTRPRQGLQLVIRRVAGSQISPIFRRASAGSEALPSLARRASMQQHAELTCRGNRSGFPARPAVPFFCAAVMASSTRQKAKGKKWEVGAQRLFGISQVGIFWLLPFAFYLPGCCFGPQSKIQNRESKIARRSPGRPKKQMTHSWIMSFSSFQNRTVKPAA